MKAVKLISLFIALSLPAASFAADTPPPPSVKKPATTSVPVKNEQVPTIPAETNEADDSRNIPQPEVRIIKKKDAVIEEYRVNGKLRFIKITPSKGNPYYMIDKDGDGTLETRNDNFTNPPINQWILLKW